MRNLLPIALALLTALPLQAQDAARRPMTTDDGLNMVSVGGAVMTPDGARVLFSKSELDWSENKSKSTYFMIPATGGEAYPYIGEEGGSSFQFSPDGRYLAFKRTVDKKAQLFLMRTDGGEAVQLSKHKTSIDDFAWAEDGSALFFVADEPRTDAEEKEQKNGADAIFVDEGPNGQDAGQWENFWKIEVVGPVEKEKEAVRLTKGDRLIGSFDVAPDGRRIVFTARAENRRNQSNLSELYLLTLAETDTTITRLTDNAAPEGRPVWAPDGRSFVYDAADDTEWELRNDKLWVMNPDTREHRMVSSAFEGNIRGYVWMPDSRRLLFTGLQRTASNLYRLDTETGALSQVTDVEGSLQALSFSKDRSRMVYSYDDADTPEDLYTSPTDRFAPTRLTDANAWVTDSLLLADMEVVRWKSTDGLEVEGLLLLPPDYEGDDRLPLLLHIHGGPAGVFTNSFRSQYHVWAGLGYAQLLPNVRGSSGYSDDLLRGNMQDIGGGDYHDLMTGVDYAIARGVAHPDSLALRGWSYGGILGGWTITQTDRFKAASIGAGVYDWTSEYGPGFNHDVRLWYIGGTPWDNPEDWRQKSALTHITNVNTPTILLHGMSDRTDTEAQSMMFFQALKDMGKTARYIRFPREGHGIREPRHQRVRDVEEIRWIQKYVRGVDWAPAPRPKAVEKKEEKPETAATSE